MKIPKTLQEMMSPEGQAQLLAAERLLTALESLKITVVSSSNVASQGTIVMSGASAELYVRLS
jgi:hypothetical protein